jgi:hypothetical protein
MIRIQIQLPDELYRRIKRLAAERETSLAEMTRRGLELLLGCYPAPRTTKAAGDPAFAVLGKPLTPADLPVHLASVQGRRYSARPMSRKERAVHEEIQKAKRG